MPRLFISVDIPNEVVNEVEKIKQEIRSNPSTCSGRTVVKNFTSARGELVPFKGTFVKKENLHVTLIFLGDVHEDQVKKIKESLQNIKFNSFKVSLNNLGVFSEDKIRVIWIGIRSEALLALQVDIAKTLSWLNLKNENNFHAHLTIARVESVENQKKLKELIANIDVQKIEFEVNSFDLQSSELSKEGPKHSIIAKYSSNL